MIEDSSTSFPERSSEPKIGYKKLKDGWLCELEILGTHNETRKSVKDPNFAKFRTNKVKVLSISRFSQLQEPQTCAKGESLWKKPLIYNVGEIVEEKEFDNDLDEVCSGGIHYFLTKEAAVCFSNQPWEPYNTYRENGSLFSTWKYVNVTDIDTRSTILYRKFSNRFENCIKQQLVEDKLLCRTRGRVCVIESYYGTERRYFELLYGIRKELKSVSLFYGPNHKIIIKSAPYRSVDNFLIEVIISPESVCQKIERGFSQQIQEHLIYVLVVFDSEKILINYDMFERTNNILIVNRNTGKKREVPSEEFLKYNHYRNLNYDDMKILLPLS